MRLGDRRTRLALLLAAAGMTLAAWLASNLIDSAPHARPPELALAPPTAPQHNLAFTLIGLRAPADQSAAAAGLSSWQRQLAADARKRAAWREGRPIDDLGSTDHATLLPVPQGPPLNCGDTGPCIDVWIAGRDALAAQLGPHRLLVERCAQAADSPLVYDEPLPPAIGTTPPLMSFSNPTLCVQLLLAQAVLAQGDADALVAWLQRADRLARNVLVGSRTLIGHVVAFSALRRNWQAVADLAHNDARLAVTAPQLLQPLSPAALDPRRWMVHEAAFQQGLSAEMGQDCATAETQGWLEGLQCRSGLGWLPNVTAADIDRAWMARLERSGADAFAAASARDGTTPLGEGSALHWRNTLARSTFAIGGSSYEDYVARQADVELHRRAVLLALRAAAQPATNREAWWRDERAGADPALRKRVSWRDAGSTLVVATFADAGRSDARYRIELQLRKE